MTIQTGSIKVGDFERIGPDPDLLRLVDKIVDQNTKILEMNAELLKAFTTPVQLTSLKADKRNLRVD